MGLFGDSRAKREAQIMAPQWLRIANDCSKLVNSTVNPDVFFSRYDLLIEQFVKLSQIEHYVKFSGTKPSVQLSEFRAERDYETSLFINRSFDKLMQDVNQLKTSKGKSNKVASYFSKMSAYSHSLSISNQELLQSKKSVVITPKEDDNLNNVKLAKALLDVCTFGSEQKPSFKSKERRQAEKIAKQHEYRAMTICFEALEILGEPKTKSELLLSLDLLVYTGVGGSRTIIRNSNRLLSKDYIDDSSNIIESGDMAFNNGLFFTNLGKAYEHIYDLENALTSHKRAFSLYPKYICNIKNIIRCLNRLGRIDESINFLNELKKSPEYKARFQLNSFGDKEENILRRNVDELLPDAIKKKDKGYIYRPRISKEENLLADKYTYCDK